MLVLLSKYSSARVLEYSVGNMDDEEEPSRSREYSVDTSVPRLSLTMTPILEGPECLESSHYNGFSQNSMGINRSSHSVISNATSTSININNSVRPNFNNNEPDDSVNANDIEEMDDNDEEMNDNDDNVQEHALTALVTTNPLPIGLEAYAHNVVNATAVTALPEDIDYDNQDVETAQKQSRALYLGSALCLVVALAIIIPVTIVTSQPSVVLSTEPPSLEPSTAPSMAPTTTPISPALQQTLEWLQRLDTRRIIKPPDGWPILIRGQRPCNDLPWPPFILPLPIRRWAPLSCRIRRRPNG
jgi:hypothetical protein